MKLFYFNPNDYGVEYFIVALSKDYALEAVKKYLLKEVENNKTFSINLDTYNKWESATVDNLPDKYSIDEYEQNVVVETEIS